MRALLWGVFSPVLSAAPDWLQSSPCAHATLHELQHRGALALKFPSPDALSTCLAKPNAKFCYLKERLSLTPTVSASASTSLCLPQACDAFHMAAFLDQLCLVPSCDTLVFVPSLQALCAAVQPVHCDPGDRVRPKSHGSVSLHCVDAAEFDEGEIIVEDQRRVRRLEGGNSTREISLSADEMTALVNCGSNTFRNWETLLYSGSLQDLGDYEACVEEPSRQYCVTKFYTLLTSGRCLPESCKERVLADLFDFICTHVGTDEPAMASCLDFVDVIPLDLCVTVQLLGCSRAIEMNIVNSSPGSMTLDDLFASHTKSAKDNLQGFQNPNAPPTLTTRQMLSLTAGAVTTALQAIRRVRPGTIDQTHSALEVLPPKIFQQAADTETETETALSLFSRLAELSQDAVDEGMFGAVASKSYLVVCDLSGPSKKDPDFAIAVSLLALFFIIFPLMGLLGKPLTSINTGGETAIETETETRTHSSALDRWRAKSPIARFLASFSVRNNLLKMDRSRHTLAHGPFNHLCGMRVVSLLWIVAGHSFAFQVIGSVLTNLSELHRFFQRYTFQLIISAQLSVDSFFYFSGFLLSVYGSNRIYKMLAKIGSSSPRSIPYKSAQVTILFLMVVLKRFVRLVPTMLFVLAMSYWGAPYLGSGPNWPALQTYLRDGVHGGCRRWWWASALMINNLVPGADQMECFGQGWYLANDFQFFIVGTLLIMLGFLGIRYFRIASATLFVGSATVTAYIAWRYNLTSAITGISGLPTDSAQSSLMGATAEMFAKYYNKPWCRIGPYLVGLVFGSMYREGEVARWLMKEESFNSVSKAKSTLSNRKEIDGVLVCIGHLIAGSVMFALVYAMPYNENKENAVPWNRWVDIAYFATSRSLWAVCLGWFTLILAFCPVHRVEELKLEKELDNDLVVIDDPLTMMMKRMLSGSTLCLLALFTYAAYLIHPTFQQVYYALSPTADYINEMNGWFQMLFHSVISMTVSGALYVMVESVMANLFAFIGL